MVTDPVWVLLMAVYLIETSSFPPCVSIVVLSSICNNMLSKRIKTHVPLYAQCIHITGVSSVHGGWNFTLCESETFIRYFSVAEAVLNA